MGVDRAQLLTVMRGEIDNGNAATGRRDTGRACQHRFGCLSIMQHLMKQNRVKAARGEGQLREIALHQFHAVGAQILQAGAGDAEHVGAFVESDDVRGVGGQQFGDAPGEGEAAQKAAACISGATGKSLSG